MTIFYEFVYLLSKVFISLAMIEVKLIFSQLTQTEESFPPDGQLTVRRTGRPDETKLAANLKCFKRYYVLEHTQVNTYHIKNLELSLLNIWKKTTRINQLNIKNYFSTVESDDGSGEGHLFILQYSSTFSVIPCMLPSRDCDKSNFNVLSVMPVNFFLFSVNSFSVRETPAISSPTGILTVTGNLSVSVLKEKQMKFNK